jgi:hypothetical protein
VRHKWKKRVMSVRYTSFEIDATCEKCGCIRQKQFMGYRYLSNDLVFETAPPCVGVVLEKEKDKQIISNGI